MYKIKPTTSLNLITIFVLTFLFSNLFAQEKSSNEIIVEGGSKIKVKPDVVTFTLTVEKSDTSEDKVLGKLNNEVDNLVTTLHKIGFADTTIKIDDYSVSKSLNRNDRKIYTASNILKLEMNLNTKIINQLYAEIEKSKLSDIEINYETILSQSLEKSTRQLLVQRALMDAESNGNNIAKILNLKISGVKQVSKYVPDVINGHGLGIKDFVPPEIDRDEEKRYITSFINFQVEDVELEEKITIVYEISK